MLIESGRKPEAIVEELYLTILSRSPTEEERNVASAYSQTHGGGKRPWVDVAWALINSADFLCRH